jgi:predicted RNA-binding Zn-ribbon protein involved in translation (DUF1610 family)
MAKVRSYKANGEHYGWEFRCPGCGETHLVDQSWTFNGDVECPTFSPSLLLRGGHFAYDLPMPEKDSCWCTYNAKQIEKGEEPAPFECRRCHSFVREGKIEFLSDSSHALAGQTVEIPDWDEVEGEKQDVS